MLNRRCFVAAALASGCGRKLAMRASGWLFVASAAERGIAVADLSEFRRTGSIPLPQVPAQVLRAAGRMFVTCPDARAIFEIDTAHHSIAGKLDAGGRVLAAVPVPGHAGWIAAATDQPSAIVVLDTATRKTIRRIALRSAPSALDANGAVAAIALSGDGAVVQASLEDGSSRTSRAFGSRCTALRFRQDGLALLAGLPYQKQIATLDTASGSLLARLPLSFAPARFCFNADGGQMFVTGEAEDSIAIVDTYQSQVDQTIIAGRTPYGMAVARGLLLVTNPASGDLTILDIETRRLAASVHVGGDPSEVLLTPDEQYALVLARESGDVSVVRLDTVLDRKIKTKPLFTLFPMAPRPTSSAIMPLSDS